MILIEYFKNLQELEKYLTKNEIQKAIIRKTIVDYLNDAKENCISEKAKELEEEGVFNGENRTFFSANGIRSIFYNNKNK